MEVYIRHIINIIQLVFTKESLQAFIKISIDSVLLYLKRSK